MKRSIYDTVIREAMSLPKKDPRPIPKQDKTLMKRLFEKRSIKRDTKAAARAVYNVIVTATFGTRVLEEKVPVSNLHQRMALHLNRLVATAIVRDGQLPMSIFVSDRFLSHIDFGHGRVIALRAQLHYQPKVNPTYASFIVEEADNVPPPWDEHFLEFEQVARIPFADKGNGST